MGDYSAYEQCNGVPPQESMVHYLGMNLDYELADRICCHNHRYAEPKGYLEWEPDVALFDRFDASASSPNETIFYDVVWIAVVHRPPGTHLRRIQSGIYQTRLAVV